MAKTTIKKILENATRELKRRMKNESKITAGDFLDPKPSDYRFESIGDAINWASAASCLDENRAIAVWDGWELHRVFLRGFELKPA